MIRTWLGPTLITTGTIESAMAVLLDIPKMKILSKWLYFSDIEV